ncbi:secreted RxLR effector protein 161-like [Impatiens glandulifera]|uniref:secreted RxLR effector protein 161-like n=1 Tax=Impatiens glandulifera TaxID=253017 RepID=UPI001FB06630|nr:secreted RxLR effector protein 161-like [Impatiens glandulifera]
MTDGKKSYTPLSVNPRLSRDEGTCLPDPRPYRALEPMKPHLEKAKKILKYINTSLDIGILYEKDAKFVLKGYADADFAGDRDDRRSTSGFVFLCGNTSLSWSSRKQGLVSLSTIEAEYKASTHAAQECIWLRRL